MLILLVITGITAQAQTRPLVAVTADTVLMGSAFTFTAVHQTEQEAWKAIREGVNEVIRIESVISSWDPTSETSKVNVQAGKEAVAVSNELYDLTQRCLKISKLSNGYFDISFASIDKVWKFDGREVVIPSDQELASSVRKIDYQKIILDPTERTIFLQEEGMRIGFGAIGKGYAANRAKVVMAAFGAEGGVVNAGGDLLCWGQQPGGEKWSVGIADPEKKSNLISQLHITDQAVVTSGNYEKYVEINGERYCHIIDPKTGWPVRGTQSVTIVCADAELADALATTVFVLGPAEGLRLINHLKDVECLIVDDEYEIHYSDNIELDSGEEAKN